MENSLTAFRKFICQYTNVSDNDWDLIKKDFHKQSFSKNDFILTEGEICRYFYFFDKGLVRFFCNIDGEDITKAFGVAPYCFTSKVSFRKQEEAKEGIQALEDTKVLRISYENYMKLESINSWNIFMRKLLNEIQEFIEKRMLVSKVYTAEQNYLDLLEDYPESLMKKIPLKHLASFLGVAPQSLSRIRNKIKK